MKYNHLIEQINLPEYNFYSKFYEAEKNVLGFNIRF